jgi:hypothetical protein
MKQDFIDPGDFLPEDEDDSALLETMITLSLMPRPFGMTWSREQMTWFLKKRGYKVLERYSEEADTKYYVAVKKDTTKIPDDGSNNLVEVFADEIQSILMSWLLKIAEK